MVDFKKVKVKEHERKVRTKPNIPDDLSEEDIQYLHCISWTEPMDFGELCSELRSNYDLCPEKGDKVGWAGLFENLKYYARNGYIELEQKKGRLESVQLTDKGTSLIKGLKDQDRELLKLIDD